MSEKHTAERVEIPAEMLDAATKAILVTNAIKPQPSGCALSDDLADCYISRDTPQARTAKMLAKAALEVAGLDALLAEIASLKAELSRHQESRFHPDWSLLEATRKSLHEAWARIAELHETGEHFHSCRECAEAFPCDEGEAHVQVLRRAADALREAE